MKPEWGLLQSDRDAGVVGQLLELTPVVPSNSGLSRDPLSVVSRWFGQCDHSVAAFLTFLMQPILVSVLRGVLQPHSHVL